MYVDYRSAIYTLYLKKIWVHCNNFVRIIGKGAEGNENDTPSPEPQSKYTEE